MINEIKELSPVIRDFILFKIRQLKNITGFDYKQENSEEKFALLARPKLKGWLLEAHASGIEYDAMVSVKNK